MKSYLHRLSVGTIMAIAVLGAGCGGGGSLEGTYSNANGLATLDLKSDGTAVFSGMGETLECTYAAEKSVLTLTCPGPETLEFTIHEDGSLASIGTFIGTMTKSKG